MADFGYPLVPGFWVHDLDPILVDFGRGLAIRWYGIAYLIGIVGGALLIAHWARLQRAPMARVEVQDFALTGGLCMVIGGRLGYCLFYQPHLFSDVGGGFPWWGLLRINEGGMASHGGIVGLFAGCGLFAWKRRRDLLVLCDMVCAVAPIGVMCGRIANFINAELWGHPSGPVAWGVIFPHSPPVDGMIVPRHPSQLYAMVLEGLLPLLLILPIHARHRRPGLTMGCLLVFYGIGRFIGEFWREPDPGQPGFAGIPRILGLFSKGQALTLPFLVIGIGLIIWALNRPARPDRYLAPQLPTP